MPETKKDSSERDFYFRFIGGVVIGIIACFLLFAFFRSYDIKMSEWFILLISACVGLLFFLVGKSFKNWIERILEFLNFI